MTPRIGSTAAPIPIPGSRPSRAPQPAARPAGAPAVRAPRLGDRPDVPQPAGADLRLATSPSPSTSTRGPRPTCWGLLQVATAGPRVLARPQGRPPPAVGAVRHLPARGRAPPRIHRAAIVRLEGLPARPRPDAQPAVLADPRRPEVPMGRGPGAAPGREPGPGPRGLSTGAATRASCPCPPTALRNVAVAARHHFPSRPSALTLAATSSPALSVFTFLSISLMIPSLSM